MIIGEDLSTYLDNEMATPCFNQYLSQDAFEGLKYYRNAEDIYALLQKNDPDRIIDELGVLDRLMACFPYLEENYSVQGNTLVRINN